MKEICLTVAIFTLGFVTVAFADTVVLRDGGSYSGQYRGGAINLADSHGSAVSISAAGCTVAGFP